jgi:transposase
VIEFVPFQKSSFPWGFFREISWGVASDGRGDRIAELEWQLVAGAARIADLKGELVTRDARIAELEGQLVAGAARTAELEQRVAALTKQVAELLEEVGRNSGNSHLPPSSDPPGTHSGKGKKSGRKRGGQPGHGGVTRKLLPPEEVDEVINLFPKECENCWTALPEVLDSGAKRYQQTELLPPVQRHVKEWRRHQVCCPKCGYRTRARYDAAVIPASPFGPRLMATAAALSGDYHLSRRKAVRLLDELVGVQMSVGALINVEARVSEAVEPAVDQAWEQAKQAPVKHTDGTSWSQAGKTLSVWTIATTMVTVFKILTDHTKATLEPLYGPLVGILVSDRAKELNFWAMVRRQICWAHLLRRFVAFSERDGVAGAIGRDLLDAMGVMFEYWHDFKAGKIDRATLAKRMAPLRVQVEATLERAVAADIAGLSGSCADILEHRAALWTFVEEDGVPPTNNHAEREIRDFVLWRKRSYGTQSERGNRFAERIMTVTHTARKLKMNVFEFLTACCRAWTNGTRAPLLLPARAMPP